MQPTQDFQKFQPKTAEQMTDLQTRLKEGTEYFGAAMKELMTKVETDYQISINLGLDKDNPYIIQPSFVPRNIKEYVLETESTEQSASEPIPA